MNLIAKATGLLSWPFFYNALQTVVGVPRQREFLVRQFVRPHKDDRILDIGCGTADLLTHLQPFEIRYTGIEPSEDYVRYARERWGARGPYDFHVAAIGNGSPLPVEPRQYDIALAFGVMHHLTDAQVRELVGLAATALKPGGRFVTMDPCRLPDMNLVEKFMVKYDRGLYIREVPAYAALVQTAFRSARHIEKAMNYLPYRAVVFECEDPLDGARATVPAN